jgi:putative transposase
MRENDLLQPVKKTKTITTNSQYGYPRYPNLIEEQAISYPEQTWVSDITHIRLSTGFIYLARAYPHWSLRRCQDW